MSELTKARLAKPVKKISLREHLRRSLRDFFVRRMGADEKIEVRMVDDLVLLRCKNSLSPSEINLGTLKSGRLLLQEVSERLCQEIKPDLDRLVYDISGLRILDLRVGLFFERREKIYLLSVSKAL